MDIGILIHQVVEIYKLMLDTNVLLFGQNIKASSIVVWVIIGTVFLHYFRKWIDA